jgi:hypothetical protein
MLQGKRRDKPSWSFGVTNFFRDEERGQISF